MGQGPTSKYLLEQRLSLWRNKRPKGSKGDTHLYMYITDMRILNTENDMIRTRLCVYQKLSDDFLIHSMQTMIEKYSCTILKSMQTKIEKYSCTILKSINEYE